MEALLGFLCDIIDGPHCTLQNVNDVAEKVFCKYTSFCGVLLRPFSRKDSKQAVKITKIM